ncbi:MAG: hypothetical protein BM556_07505 [Bacteriovorax sp. MedPE-SWde]|nr:MAG: hypothetical protein BM556_07505 [Bacteriovorax sp. MedPE-SWde]
MNTENNWLIRTKQNKILGPVTKEKVIELLNSGSLTDEDEVCSGNGYWFWVKEKDLVQKYLHDNQKQTFNPVAEAFTSLANAQVEPVTPESILNLKDTAHSTEVNKAPSASDIPATPSTSESSESADEEPIVFPEDDDLDYPDMVSNESSNSLLDEIKEMDYKKPTPVASTPVEKKEQKVESTADVDGEEEGETIFPDDDDLEFPDLITPEAKEITEDSAIESKAEEKVEELDLAVELSLDSPSEEVVEESAESEEEGPLQLPVEDDLEYPDMSLGESSPEETSESDSSDGLDLDISGLDDTSPSENEVAEIEDDINNILNEEKSSLEESIPEVKEVEEIESSDVKTASSPEEMPRPKKKKRRRKKKKVNSDEIEAPKRNDRLIMYVFILLIAGILYGVYFYYTQVLGQQLFGMKDTLLINSAQAQEKSFDVKKKSL